MISAIKLTSLLAITCLLCRFVKLAEANQPQRYNLPGHYEFEVAPKMEPPSVRKPPYQQSAQLCPGTDPFAGFSPRDTLCGDLNQGRVPVNPLGQSIADQSYPFELIKNKTLQFLARALPVLKLEYETIPKVARFVQQPSQPQHLLNPTHQQSSLSGDQLNLLNQRFATFNGLSRDQLNALQTPYQLASNLGVRRRRKRWARGTGSAVAIAELLPNASLVISSAHSGRILEPKGRHSVSSALSVLMPAQLNETGNQAISPLGVITKDGYKSLPAASVGTKAAGAPRVAVGQSGNGRQPEQTNKPTAGVGQQPQQARLADGANITENSPVAPNNDNHASKSISSKTGPPAAKENRRAELDDLTGSASGVPASFLAAPEAMGQARSSNGPAESAAAAAAAAASQAISGAGHGHHQEQNRQRPDSLAKRTTTRLPCSETANGFTSAVCQAAAALIEGDRVPAWLQLAKHLGNAYAASSDNLASAGNPVWSILASLAQESSPKSSSLAQTKSNFFNLLGPITSLLTGGSGQAASKSEPGTTSRDSAGEQQSVKHQSGLSSLSSSTLARLALAGWASNAIASLVEYFVPSVFQSMGNRGFAKRKKPYDSQETFVDTPASIAAQLAATGRSQSANLVQLNKQPPTPCPSVEEYISPTFARNYQGAWKYVVQIPHEGYFTQTIQRTSCVRQKCEFTDGVCHESPRWVSLLVAEIYYPNTVYAGAGQLDQTASSTNNVNQLAFSQQQQQQLQQAYQVPKSTGNDPLQMTDSNYNMNLNSAFVNAAHELGLDPNNVASMQQLANAYNYQISQRYGNLNAGNQQQQQQPVAESRASLAFAQPTGNGQQQYSQPAETNLYQTNYNEYITALAAEALRQNPSMSVNDLINSLQVSKRKKRDLAASQARRNNQSPAGLQSRSTGNVESVQSLNEIGILPNNNAQFKPSQQQPEGLQVQQQVGASSQNSPPPINSGNPVSATDQASSAANQNENGDQMECDGHDKIGCYVVRVYYDWFLVNGSCKCWKTNTGSSGSSSSSGGNSFLRRIFTG